jgi:outer membrane protein assembly factor BamB
LPLEKVWTRTLDGHTNLLPIRGPASPLQSSLIYLYDGKGKQAIGIDAVSGQTRWALKAPAADHVLFGEADLAVFVGAGSLVAVDLDESAVAWSKRFEVVYDSDLLRRRNNRRNARWKGGGTVRSTGTSERHEIIACGRYLAYGSQNGIAVIEIRTGRLVWSRETQAPPRQLQAYRDALLASDAEGHTALYELDSGSQRFARTTLPGSALLCGNHLIGQVSHSDIAAWSVATGQEEWRRPLTRGHHTWLDGHGDLLAVSSSLGGTHLLNIDDGTEALTRPDLNESPMRLLAIDDQSIILSKRSGLANIWALERKTGASQWSLPLKDLRGPLLTEQYVVLVEQRVARSDEGIRLISALVILDRDTGETAQRFELVPKLVNQVVPVANGIACQARRSLCVFSGNTSPDQPAGSDPSAAVQPRHTDDEEAMSP